jgi:phytoene dehydrogenase-like protein
VVVAPRHANMSARYDAVVIGSGPNGLVAANHLADRGWAVIVLEAGPVLGGAVRSAEVIEPGFVHDLCSAFYPLAVASSAIGDLELDRHGLRWLHAPQVLAHPALDGTCPVLSRSLDETASSLDALHLGDGAAWRDLFDRWRLLQPGLLDAFVGPFPPLRAGASLARSVPPTDLARLARFALLPVRRMGEEEFAGDAARRLLAGLALHADIAPEGALSGFLGWLLMALGQDVGFPVPEGGASALTGALVARLVASGGEVACNTRAVRVRVESGRAVGVELEDGSPVVARRAVLADVAAPVLYRSLLTPDVVSSKMLADLDRFHWDDATFKVDWSLDGPIPWSSLEARGAGTVHVAEGVDELTVVSSELARGLIPSAPFLLIGQQSMIDSSRQPPGKETAWAYTHVPRMVRGDAGGVMVGDWARPDVEAFLDRIERRVEVLAPGFRDLIRGRHVQTPVTFEAENENLQQGSVNGGTAQLHQQLVFRPVPGLGRPSTPIRSLFLSSSSSHPGGGVHGAPGRNAARAAVAADRLRRVCSGWRPRKDHGLGVVATTRRSRDVTSEQRTSEQPGHFGHSGRGDLGVG